MRQDIVLNGHSLGAGQPAFQRPFWRFHGRTGQRRL